MSTVMTVTGPIGVDQLGVTHLHEHLLSDFRCYLPEAAGSATDGAIDGGRIRSILALADAGYAEQVAVSQDICQRTHTTAFGGEGLDHILTRAVPLMRRMGADDGFIQQLMVHTPARVLAVDS